MTTKHESKRSTSKKRYKNQDKHRWRNLLAWFIPLFAASIIAVIVTDGHNRFWTAFVSILVLLTYAWILLERYISRTSVQRRRVRIVISTLCIFVISVAVWKRPQNRDPITSPRPWLHLTADERQRFIAVLASQTEPRERVRLGCPAANEEVCILVTPFIDAFKRGHFIVENDRVERLTLGKPAGGVVLFKYGHADAFTPQDPDQGVWVNISPSLATVETAFAEIGINATSSADESLPQDLIAVFFGIESKEPRERENLKELMKRAEQQYGKPIPSPIPSLTPTSAPNPNKDKRKDQLVSYVNRAEALYKQGKYQEAIALCDKALAIDPTDRNASTLKSRIMKTRKILESKM